MQVAVWWRSRNARAWEIWREVGRYADLPLTHPLARADDAGCVDRVHQPARRGTKALVHFGAVAEIRDTWWPGRRPSPGRWVLVDVRAWRPPGTHSGNLVLVIDRWHGEWPERLARRAYRYERRLAQVAKEGLDVPRGARVLAAGTLREGARPCQRPDYSLLLARLIASYTALRLMPSTSATSVTRAPASTTSRINRSRSRNSRET